MTRAFLFAICVFAPLVCAQQNRGYYRFPAISGNTIVFTAEGDLWQVDANGGVARRLTTHPGEESNAAFSQDGKTIAFSANYEGPTEVYTMPAAGGLPTRRTFEGGVATVVGWTSDGKVIYRTNRYSTLPDQQLGLIDAQHHIELVPLSQAAQGAFDPRGTLYFTRLPFQGSYAKRYQGGTAQQIWKYTAGNEAVGLTTDFAGTSKDAMWWNDRVYFLSDRDGTMNIWSMDANGKNLRQHTKNTGWDAAWASMGQGRIVYQMGADIHLYDIAANRDRTVDIELASDFDHLRENWIKTPNQYLTSVHLSYTGDAVSLVARGKTFVAPAKKGRFVEATPTLGSRVREAIFMPDGKSLIGLSTQSGEVELWKIPANGVGTPEQLTNDGKVLRWNAFVSPNGKWVVHQDKDNQLWLLELETKANKKIAIAEHTHDNSEAQFQGIAWSPDSRWFAVSVEAANMFRQIFVYNLEQGTMTAVTTGRYNDVDPAWSSDGKWLYFLSDRRLQSTVGSPWGVRQPDPHFDKPVKIYQIALQTGQRSPFAPPDELHPDGTAESKDGKAEPKADPKKEADVRVEIDFNGIMQRLEEVPAPPGNYSRLTAPAKRLCFRESANLQCMDVANKGDKPETLMEGAGEYQISGDGKKMLVRKGGDIYVFDSSIREGTAKTPKTLTDSKVDLQGWTFAIVPAEEYRELFLDAWRLHRDYFYDRGMHGISWTAVQDKYMPTVARVRDRAELSDLIAQMVSELSVLHTFVRGGDLRQGDDQIQIAALGAHIERDFAAGGYIIRRIYESDPDRPDQRSPLADPAVEAKVGDVILSVNGRDVLSATDIGELLRTRAGKQVLLRLRPAAGGDARDVVVTPISIGADRNLRYGAWEYTRREQVETAAKGQIGYLHLKAMGTNDINQWAEQFYPVYDRPGLIIDVRHNNGGNIDSWILGKLLRKDWFTWQPRVGESMPNMQYAFRGHVVVLMDERTSSDGEAFSEGFRRLGLGKLIGTRTWGGEIWLTQSNSLADSGIATAAELGVFADGKWLIEGHGVDPDIVVDNLPHATFEGKDAQLEAAIAHLQKLIAEKPIKTPAPPPYPNKKFPAEAGK